MKLLAKTAEERYQTAAGVAGDLRHCLAEWQTHSRIDPFRSALTIYRTGYSFRRSFTAGSAKSTRCSLPLTVSWPMAPRSWC
jgi:hypothetical protein